MDIYDPPEEEPRQELPPLEIPYELPFKAKDLVFTFMVPLPLSLIVFMIVLALLGDDLVLSVIITSVPLIGFMCFGGLIWVLDRFGWLRIP